MLLITLSVLNSQNLGHRLGGDIYKPENTLFSYNKALKLQKKKSFVYVEFDVRETKDGELIIFHDSTIKRLVPKNSHNLRVLKKHLKKKKFERIYIKDLTLSEISHLLLQKKAHIPTLKEVLEASIKWKLKKPMHIEIKQLDSDKARYKLVELITQYNKKIDISIIAFRKYFYKSFPFSPRWIQLFKEKGIEAYQIDKYSFTKNIPSCSPKETFTPLLSETSFSISKKSKRIQKFSFSLPKILKCSDTLQIGIFDGKDNSGDNGVTFRIENQEGKIILSGFSNSSSWEWFVLKPKQNRNFTLIIEDIDTSFTGKYPGNGGKVKVILRANR